MSAWVIDTLLYTGALIGVVLVLRRPVGRFFGPQLAYALWALPFLRLLLPPIVLPASFAPTPEPVAQTLPSAALPAEPAVVDLSGEAFAAAVPAAMPAAPSWEWADLMAVAASLWAGVALAFLVWRAVTYRGMCRELLEGAKPVGEIGRIRLVETPALVAPVAFGVLDKVIALPPLFMAQPDIAARDLAIQHELAHHNGHDLLANMAAQALLALHWFNPIAWYGWRAMRRDQEAACDARVLAGRGREDRLRYAALIAGVATGPRPIAFKGALAAPMACPVLGERSIVHRLRSLSMSEMSRRRRWAGRTLIGASVLALPLTASISYAAASVQPTPPAPPAPPAPLSAVAPPAPPAPPEAPELEAGERETHTFVLRSVGHDGEPIVRHFSVPHPPQVPQIGQMPQPPQPPQPPRFGDFAHGVPGDAEWEARMEEFGRAMEKWGEDFGEKFAAQAEAQAEAWAEAERHMPEIVESCDASERRRTMTTMTADGRPRIVLCEREIELAARSSLSLARNAIARNRDISQNVRREVLRDLDEEIERLESERH